MSHSTLHEHVRKIDPRSRFLYIGAVLFDAGGDSYLLGRKKLRTAESGVVSVIIEAFRALREMMVKRLKISPKNKPVHISEFNLLSEKEQQEWSWRADEQQREEIKGEFLRLYGHPKIERVIVDGYGIADHPCVYVEIKPVAGRLRLPKHFMHRIVIRRYLSTGKLVFK